MFNVKSDYFTSGPKRQTLFEAFISSVEDYLGITSTIDNTLLTDNVSTPEKLPNDTTHKVFTDHIEKQIALKQLDDPLLRLNFQNLVKRASLSSELCEEEDKITK